MPDYTGTLKHLNLINIVKDNVGFLASYNSDHFSSLEFSEEMRQSLLQCNHMRKYSFFSKKTSLINI